MAERFVVLAEQLSSAASVPRIAGPYVLRDLAIDQESARIRSLEMIAAYLKAASGRDDVSYDEVAVAGGQIAATSCMASENGDEEKDSFDLARVDLSGYSFRRIHVDGGYFPDVDRRGAGQPATTTCTMLTGEDMHGADLSGGRR